MSTKKVKVDVSDKEGNKFTVTFEGRVTRQKVLQLLDLVEILGGVSSSTEVNNSFPEESKFAKVFQLIEKSFPVGWFSSKDIQSIYESVHGESIGLSTVSTYLNRLSQRNVLYRSGSAMKRYRLQRETIISNSAEIRP
jgi:hypothetical protein